MFHDEKGMDQDEPKPHYYYLPPFFFLLYSFVNHFHLPAACFNILKNEIAVAVAKQFSRRCSS